ncbi:MAG: hypothetical protein ABWY25_05315 [Paenisporosarcina sp.]
MTTDLQVVSRTQRIIVEPASRSISIINAGPMGPGGPAGSTGDPGEPGGSLLSAFWQYSNTAGTPPSNGQMRTNGPPITELYVNEIDTDGYNRSVGLATISTGSTILVRAANSTSMDLDIIGPPVDNGTWWTIPVSVLTGTVTKGSRTQLNFVNPLTGVTDHGLLTGLTDDDHPLYLIGVVKATEPTAADYGLASIPVGAVWIRSEA